MGSLWTTCESLFLRSNLRLERPDLLLSSLRALTCSFFLSLAPFSSFPQNKTNSSGVGGLKLSDDAEEASFPLVPRPREGPRGLLESSNNEGGAPAAPPPPSPGPPAAPPPTPSGVGGGGSSNTAAAAPLFSPANSRLLAAMDSALSRFLPRATEATEARNGRRGSCFCSSYLSAEERSVALAALAVAPLWFGAQLSFNASLTRTSVTSNTILSTASSLFTYALAVALLKEPATFKKGISVAACVAGVAAVALADSFASKVKKPSSPSRSRTLAGDALVLLSCTLYAGYTVAVRALLVDEDGGAATVRTGFFFLFSFFFFFSLSRPPPFISFFFL